MSNNTVSEDLSQIITKIVTSALKVAGKGEPLSDDDAHELGALAVAFNVADKSPPAPLPVARVVKSK